MKTILNKILVIVFAGVLGNTSFSQDTINYRNGGRLSAKVTEISATTVSYKKQENLSGPTYSDLKNDIASVQFANGTKEEFGYEAPAEPAVITPVIAPPSNTSYYPMQQYGKTKFLYGNRVIGNHEMHDILLSLNNERITDLLRTAKKQARGQYAGFLIFPLGIAALAIEDNSSGTGLNDEKLASILVGGLGVASVVTSITLKVKRHHNEQEALKLYQQMY
ncbi:MAG: hypothetical protein ACJ77K_03220 [Bacteroidia bacterium]